MKTGKLVFSPKATTLSLIIASLLAPAAYAENLIIDNYDSSKQVEANTQWQGDVKFNNTNTGQLFMASVDLGEGAKWKGNVVGKQSSSGNAYTADSLQITMDHGSSWVGGIQNAYVIGMNQISLEGANWTGNIEQKLGEGQNFTNSIQVYDNSKFKGNINVTTHKNTSYPLGTDIKVESGSVWEGNYTTNGSGLNLNLTNAKWLGDAKFSGTNRHFFSADLTSSQWIGDVKMTHTAGHKDEIAVQSYLNDNSIWQGNIIVDSSSTGTSNNWISSTVAGNSLWKGDINANMRNKESDRISVEIADNALWVGNLTSSSNSKTEDEKSSVSAVITNGSQWTGNLNSTFNTALASETNIIVDNNSRWLGDLNLTSKVKPSATRPADQLNVDISKNSDWTGKLTGKYVESTLTMNDSVWNMTGNSNVTHLVSNSGSNAVNFTTLNSAKGPYTTLTTNDIRGDFDFHLRAGVVGSKIQSEKIVLANDPQYSSAPQTQAGNHNLFIQNNGAATNVKPQQVVVVENNTNQTHNFKLNNTLELGGYLYQIAQSGNNWVLEQATQGTSGISSTMASTGSKQGAAPRLTSTAEASANVVNTNYLLTYAEMQSLMQRMGDLRQDNAGGNVWLRGVTGRLKSFDNGILSGTSMKYHGFQLGADKQFNNYDGSRMHVGVLLGITDADPSYSQGDGTIKSTSSGLYASYIFPDSTYVDAVVKYNHMKNDFKVFDTAGTKVKGKSDSNGISASLAAGHRFYFNDSAAGYYMEPQAQLTVSHQEGDDFTASNGLRTKVDAYTSTLGQVGALIGYEVKSGKAPINIYLQTAFVREFTADSDYSLNGSKHNQSFKGNWWKNGVGASAQFNDHHTLHVDMDLTSGSRFNQSQVNAGYRYSF